MNNCSKHKGHKGFSLATFVAFVFILSACLQLPDCFREDVFCAALVTDTLGIDDHGMNQNTWAGLQEAQVNKLTDRIEYIESVNVRDYEKNIVYFASQGFDMIVTTNPGLRDDTLHAADLYPDSVFVGMNQAHTESLPNLIPVTFAEDQMGFVAGVLAAHISTTRVVGAVCETSGLASMWRYCEGFRAGAEFTDPEIKVIIFYRDDGDSERFFIDEAWGFESASKAILRGADVIFVAGGVTGQGALRAAAVAKIPAIGTERDQRAALAESGSSVVTSFLGQASFEVQEVMRLLQAGNFPEAVLGQVGNLTINEDYPQSLQEDLNLLFSSLKTGEIKTNVTTAKP